MRGLITPTENIISQTTRTTGTSSPEKKNMEFHSRTTLTFLQLSIHYKLQYFQSSNNGSSRVPKYSNSLILSNKVYQTKKEEQATGMIPIYLIMLKHASHAFVLYTIILHAYDKYTRLDINNACYLLEACMHADSFLLY